MSFLRHFTFFRKVCVMTNNWFDTVVVGEFKTNCYILHDGDEFAVIDPGADAARIFRAIRKHHPANLKLKVLLTHGHYDHIRAIPDIVNSLDSVEIHVSQNDVLYLTEPRLNGSKESPPLINLEDFRPYFHTFTGDGEEISVGSIVLRVIAVAGHTPGGVFFISDANRTVFSGDSLFKGAIGTSNPRVLMASLRYATKNIPGDYKVYPGHGDPTTIADEKAHGTF